MRFDTTEWSVVIAAGGEDSSAARQALGTLVELYWYPLYAYVRRYGRGAEEARDLTQAFLASLIERRDFDRLSADRGRFRAFLLAALQHFLANDAARRRTLKRGGDRPMVSLDDERAEARYRLEPPAPSTPETIFDRGWAMTVIENVFDRLRREADEAGRRAEFDACKACLLGDAPDGGYAAVAGELGTTEGAIKVAVHRLRRRFRDALREAIARTVSDERAIDDEIRHLIRCLDA